LFASLFSRVFFIFLIFFHSAKYCTSIHKVFSNFLSYFFFLCFACSHMFILWFCFQGYFEVWLLFLAWHQVFIFCWAKVSLGGPLGTSHLDFPRPIELWKIIKKYLNNFFHNFFFMSTYIRFHRLWNSNNIKNIVYFDVPNHCI
jgi:hypothetical protein